MTQLLTVGKTGQITSLKMKGGLDLRELGPIKMERSSLIELDEAKQAFFIRLLRVNVSTPEFAPIYREVVASFTLAYRAGMRAGWLYQQGWGLLPFEAPALPLYFKEYDDAVKCEIELIQKLRQLFGANFIL